MSKTATHSTDATITISTDPRYAQTILATFTKEDYPLYEDRYEAAAEHFDTMLEKLSETNANKGGLVSFTEDEATFAVIVSDAGETRVSSRSNVGGNLPA